MSNTSVALRELMLTRGGGVDPSKFSDEVFELYSIPAFDVRKPEVTLGGCIGSSKQIVQEGDVLLSKIVPHVRRSWVVGASKGFRTIASGEWIIFRSDRVVSDYLRHVLVGDPFHAQFMQTVSGVGGSLLRARPSFVADIHIPLPRLAEQKRIATILDQADFLRAKRRYAIKLLDDLAMSVFVDMFESKGGEDTFELGSRLDFITSGGRGWAKFYSQEGSRFIRSIDVQMNYIGEDDVVFVQPPENAEARRTLVKADDVLLTITGSKIGRVAPVLTNNHGAFISQHVAILRFDKKKIEPAFLAYFLSLAHGGQRQIENSQYGQTKPGLNFDQIRGFKIPNAPIELQQKFCQRLASIELLKNTQRAQLAKLDTLFSSLQHRAFRGEL